MHMTTILAILAIVVLIGIFTSTTNNNEHDYSASFGDKGDFFSFLNHGYSVGGVALTQHQSAQNFLVCGATGSGKSSKVILPSLVSTTRTKSSHCIYDPSGSENYNLASKFMKERRSRNSYYFNPADPHRSEQFNPLQLCKTDSDIDQLMTMLWMNSDDDSTTSSGDGFWKHSVIMTLGIMGRYLVHHAREEDRTIENLLRMIDIFCIKPEALDKAFAKTHDERLIEKYSGLVSTPERTLQNILVSCKVALKLWNNKEVCRVTARNTIPIHEFRRVPSVLWICTPLASAAFYRPLTAVLFQHFFDYALSKIPEKDEAFLYVFLEEAATFRFPNFATTVSNVRKFRTSILTCVQDESSILDAYKGDGKSILTNLGCKVYLEGTPLHTAKEISQRGGKYTYIENGQKRSRELLTADEVQQCKEALVCINSEKILRFRATPYFENWRQSHLFRNDPLEVPVRDLPDAPLISFE